MVADEVLDYVTVKVNGKFYIFHYIAKYKRTKQVIKSVSKLTSTIAEN